MHAHFIEKLRKQHSLTKEMLSRELGISRPTYAKFEKGQVELNIPQIEKLAQLFNTTLNDLLHENETEILIHITDQQKKKVKTEIRIHIPQQNLEKFKQILLYILKKVGGKPNVGMTVIYKLLYFIDFDYYEKFEEQLMGLKYIKNHFGPTPLIFEKVMEDLINNNQVECIRSKFYRHEQKKYLINPNLEPNLSILNGQEKEHIDWELQRLSDLTASKLSELSHKDVPWISAQEGKPLDYESVFYRTKETSIRDYLDDTEN